MINDTANLYAWTTQSQYYNTSGTLQTEIWNNDDGTSTISGFANSLILTSTTANDTMTGGSNTETFVFNPSFGRDTVTDFIATGATHDVIQFDHTLFATYAQVMSSRYPVRYRRHHHQGRQRYRDPEKYHRGEPAIGGCPHRLAAPSPRPAGPLRRRTQRLG